MTEAQQESSDRGDQPGKSRTLWHPLLARLLEFALSDAFTVVPEVLVGKMPLRVDILLVRREGGAISEAKRREVAALLPLLNQFTLIEFKGPTDSLQRGDFAQLAGCAFLWHGQQHEAIKHDEISLIVLAPMINGPLRGELQHLGLEASEHEPGIFRVAGLPFAVWLVETDAMARKAEPVLSLVSRILLREHQSIIDELRDAGHAALTDYVIQQVHQLNIHREDIAVQSGVSDAFAELDEKFANDYLASLPAEWRVRGLPAEERVRGLPAEERVRGLSLEQRLAGLSAEELAEFLKRNRGD